MSSFVTLSSLMDVLTSMSSPAMSVNSSYQYDESVDDYDTVYYRIRISKEIFNHNLISGSPNICKNVSETYRWKYEVFL